MYICMYYVADLLMLLKVIRNPFFPTSKAAVFEHVCICVQWTCIFKSLKGNVSFHAVQGETCPLHHHVERSSTAVTSLTFLS